MGAKTTVSRAAENNSRTLNGNFNRIMILKHFFKEFQQEMEYDFTNMILKTKYNQNNGYQKAEVFQLKQKWTSQNQKSWQQLFGILKVFCLLTFERTLHVCNHVESKYTDIIKVEIKTVSTVIFCKEIQEAHLHGFKHCN